MSDTATEAAAAAFSVLIDKTNAVRHCVYPARAFNSSFGNVKVSVCERRKGFLVDLEKGD